MKNKNKPQSRSKPSAGFNPIGAASDDFYAGSPAEKPLYDNFRKGDSGSGRMTERHRAKKRKETMDPRDKQAFIAILKLCIFLVLLLISFALLWKGIGLYEERTMLKMMAKAELPPVLQKASFAAEDDEFNPDAGDDFSRRIVGWQEAERLVRSSDAFRQGDYAMEAIKRCNEALRLVPTHSGALRRLADLYFENGKYIESVNAYIRLLSIDPSQVEVQKNLIKSLDAFEDYKAVRRMAEWYLSSNMFDAEVLRYLANATFADGDYEAAIAAYNRVLENASEDIPALEKLAAAFIKLERYEDALEPLTQLRKITYTEPEYHRLIAISRSSLNLPKEAVSALGRASQVFGERVVMGWLQDASFNSVREDRSFKAFTERIGGQDFRKWLEKMAKDDTYDPVVDPTLKLGKLKDDRAEDMLKLKGN